MNENEYIINRTKYEKSWLNCISPSARQLMHPILLSVLKLKNRLSGFKTHWIYNRSAI